MFWSHMYQLLMKICTWHTWLIWFLNMVIMMFIWNSMSFGQIIVKVKKDTSFCVDHYYLQSCKIKLGFHPSTLHFVVSHSVPNHKISILGKRFLVTLWIVLLLRYTILQTVQDGHTNYTGVLLFKLYAIPRFLCQKVWEETSELVACGCMVVTERPTT